MKKTLIALGTTLMLSSTMVMADKGGDRMFKRLDLSPEQTTQVRALGETHRAQMMALRSTQMSEIRALLTPEQVTEFDEMIAKRQAKMSKRMGKHGG